MRAKEFINEEREEWSHMASPEIAQTWDAMDQAKRGRAALTTMPIPKQTSARTVSPDSPFADKTPVKTNDLKGYPTDWDVGYPSSITPKMINPTTGDVKLGTNKIAQPGTEEYAMLKKQIDPTTGAIRYFQKPAMQPSLGHERTLQQQQQQTFNPITTDKGKEVTWPSRQNKTYQMVDPARQKNRT
jgi:hypothetical protein